MQNFHFYLSWPSSDMSASSDWIIGPQAQPIQPKQYSRGNWSPQKYISIFFFFLHKWTWKRNIRKFKILPKNDNSISPDKLLQIAGSNTYGLVSTYLKIAQYSSIFFFSFLFICVSFCSSSSIVRIPNEPKTRSFFSTSWAQSSHNSPFYGLFILQSKVPFVLI